MTATEMMRMSRGEMRYWKGVVALVFHKADTLTIRLIIANASLLWAVGAMLVPETFQRRGYQLLNVVPHWLWIIGFMAHFLGVYWRIFDPKQRVTAGLVVNTLGLFMWLLTTILINIGIGEFALGTSLEVVICFASAWALYRTGRTSEFKIVTD